MTHVGRAALAAAALALALANWARAADDSVVEIPDDALRGAVEAALEKAPGEPITRAEMESLSELSGSGVGRLDGIEHAVNLVVLAVPDGSISDLAPLAGLTSLSGLELRNNAVEDVSALGSLESLQRLILYYNEIEDVSALGSLESLWLLYLSGNAIEDVSALGSLESLTRLHLSGNAITDVSALGSLGSLQQLVLSNNAVEDVSALGSLGSLTGLYLHNNAITDVSALGSLESLEFLDLSGNAVEDVSALVRNMGLGDGDFLDLRGNPLSAESIETHIPVLLQRGVDVAFGIIVARALRRAIEDALGKGSGEPITRAEMENLSELSAQSVPRLDGIEHAVNLVELRVQHGSISDLAPLAGLTSLERLTLYSTEITDVSALGSLTSLEQLNLSFNAIEDVSALGSLGSLTSLELSNNAITDVSALGSLTSLEQLNLSFNAIEDVSALGSLGSLQVLHLNDNAITDVSALGSLGSLQVLNLYNNAITDVSALGSLGSLTSLNLYNNAITDVSALGSLGSLQVLNLYNNAIEDVSALGSLGSLQVLHLNDNAITDVSALGSLGSLTSLSLYNNAITDVSALGSLGSLTSLSLYNNEITDVSALGSLGSLTSLSLYNNAIEDVSALGSLGSLTSLSLYNNAIEDVSALGSLGSLGYLNLSGNAIEDVSALGSLGSLRTLYLSSNAVEDVSALGSLESLAGLSLSNNAVEDVSALGSLGSLRWLSLSNNAVEDVSALGSLESLWWLSLSNSAVEDVSALGSLVSLQWLYIRNNAVQDLSPLLGGGRLAMVDARGNPLSGEPSSALGTLRERGVTVLAGEAAPYFPAAGGGREGFARIINRSDADGEVLISAVDDGGNRFGPARMEVGARRTVHFNSRDLEDGNAAKGLRGGVGRPTVGDWRLEVTSSLDVEVLSYARTDDGFVTAMHDVAEGGTLPFFNPGSNERQRSILRLVNMQAAESYVGIGGYDDRGVEHRGEGFTMGAEAAASITATEMEGVHGLGDGHGKWRLLAPGFPWLAMSLLESPTGHLANLSAAPDNAEPLAGGGARHRVPLFPAAGGARHGFVRVVNRSYRSGDVAIAAVDDAGNRSGPARLEIGRRQTAHFNSSDLEAGNAAKGLSGGVGTGEGDWRLELTSTLDLQVLSYVRTADGFVTSMHELVPRAEDGSHRVVFFNPGSNSRQVSKLRLVNDGERAASATIAGVDDGGSDSGTVAVTVPAGRALTFTSAQLEAGGGALSGGLGVGSGKWRLRVESDARLSVMSLLESPTGHLANVSTGTKGRRWLTRASN